MPKQRTVEKRIFEQWTEEELLKEILPKYTIIFDDYERFEMATKVLFYTGMRPQELCKLKREDVRFDENKIIIRQSKRDKDRIIPFISNKFKRDFEAYCEGKEGLIFNMYYSTIVYMFSQLREYLDLSKDATPYITRRSFARYCHKYGFRINVIQQMMGHNDIKTTEGYLQTNEQDIMDELERVKQLNKGEL